MTARRTAPGRPRRFDEETAIAGALELFWANGYEHTTTRMLEETLGISQSSIYNAFGSKAELLDAALDRYEAEVQTTLVEPLVAAGGSAQALDGFVTSLTAWVRGPDTPGCMLLNAMLDPSGSIPQLAERGVRYRSRLRSVFNGALRHRAPDEATAAARAELLLAAAMGLSLVAKAATDPQELAAMSGAIRNQIATW